MARVEKWEIDYIDLTCGDSVFVEETKYCQRSKKQIFSPNQKWMLKHSFHNTVILLSAAGVGKQNKRLRFSLN